MKLRIEHATTYQYALPVTLQPHRLMLSARGSHDLRIISASLHCVPDARLNWSLDVFGNVVATATFPQPTAELSITAHTLLEQSATAWPVFPIAVEAHSYPFRYSEADSMALGGFAVPLYPDDEGALLRWAKSHIRPLPTDTLSLLKTINSALPGTITYRTREEEGTQTPQETLTRASGSCRDIATLFIETARQLGFGARMVSGYLFTPETPANNGGTTHAWAEIYLPGAGWIAFDPTHGRVGSAGLIPLAAGRSNAQIMPVTGGYAGAAADFLAMKVNIAITLT